MKKKNLSFLEIWNMSFGFLGIQFGFALQGGNMTRIFQTLGASQDEIPMLWIAAPLTGLLVQPIIGYMSDRTWSKKWGRRKPYFFLGAVLSTIALFFMPYSPYLWMAAGFLWILDASINISMEPFRALVADLLPEKQRSYGFVVQALIIGIGTWIASNLPWMVSKLGVSDAAEVGMIPMSVKVSFAIGAFVFMASILYTIFTTKEYPPEDMAEFEKEKAEGNKYFTTKKNNFISDIINNVGNMPSTMKKLGVVQFFSWFAFFTMWSMSNPALTEHVYHTPAPIEKNYNMEDVTQKEAFDTANTAFQKSSNLVSSNMGIYGLSSMAFALLLVFYTSKKNINRKLVHMFSLILGGFGFLIMVYLPEPTYLVLAFALIGFAWGSILSMPYAMLSSAIDPKKMGVFMGIFNMFIVIPQIIGALGGINYISNLFGEKAINAMLVAGLSLIIAGFCNLLITDKAAISYQGETNG